MPFSNLTDSSGSSPVINVANLALRVLQLLFAIVVVAAYAAVGTWAQSWDPEGYSALLKAKFVLAITVASLSMITDIALAVIPFVLSYHYVAMCFIWEWTLFFLWTALFAWTKDTFSDFEDQDQHWVTMQKMIWVDLASMLLWLVTALMGPAMLIAERKSLRSSRALV